jgi:phosphatidylserine synthase
MKALSDRLLHPLITLAHERLGLSPNQVSTLGFLVGLVAAGLVALGSVDLGICLMALSQIIDGVDGGIARQYNLTSRRGVTMELIYDRLSELLMFLALVVAGMASLRMAILAFVAILILTAVERTSDFDPGAKRFVLYFGWVAQRFFAIRGFELALHVVFIVNLAGIAVGTVIAEYRLQKQVDAQAIREREEMRSLGIPVPHEDPPTLLSRLFSWL